MVRFEPFVSPLTTKYVPFPVVPAETALLLHLLTLPGAFGTPFRPSLGPSLGPLGNSFGNFVDSL